jgi:hypothetical protein
VKNTYSPADAGVSARQAEVRTELVEYQAIDRLIKAGFLLEALKNPAVRRIRS